MTGDFVIHEEGISRLEERARQLRHDSNAKAVSLMDAYGQQLAAAGEIEQFDPTSLASLRASGGKATDGLAKLIGEREFSVLFQAGSQDHIHISIVADRAILAVVFDERSTLGLVRLRVKRATDEFKRIFDAIPGGWLAEMTDERIKDLFSE